MIDKFTEQKIKEAANIVDVISDFLEVRRKGVNYQTLCPFHNDRHLGSFVIHPARNCYVCFSCEAKGGPIDFLMNYAKMDYPDALRYLAQKYGIYIDEEEGKKFKNVKPAKPRSIADAIPADLPPKLWPTRWIDYYTGLDTDNLVRWLRSLPMDSCQRKRLEQSLKDYYIGHTGFAWKAEWHEFTIFWQIDELGRLHNGHLMKYTSNGHRDKTEDGYTQTWLHARMRYATGINHFDDRKNSASYCLFGQHLLRKYPRAKVNLVESEKTALIMSALYGNDEREVWMACGGLQNINRDRLATLIRLDKDIVLFPDRDGVDAWRKKATELQYKHLRINTKAVLEWWEPDDGDKADIADVVVNALIRHAPSRPQTAGEVVEQLKKENKAFATLVDKLNLKPEDNGTEI